MKLRVRFQGRRELIELSSTEETLSVLKEIVSQRLSLPDDSFQLSLDGKTPLSTGNRSTLIDLGVVGGDLLHVLVDNKVAVSTTASVPDTTKSTKKNELHIANQELLEQLLQMGFCKESVIRALHTTKIASLNEALDILSRERPSTSTATANTTKDLSHLDETTDKPKSNISSNEILSGSETIRSEKDRVMSLTGNACGNTAYNNNSDSKPKYKACVNQQSHGESLKLQKIEYTPKALLCRDGIPYLLQMCYEQALITTLHEAVCIAVHVLMLETGFGIHTIQENITKQLTTDEEPSASRKEDTNTAKSLLVVPYNWRASCGAKFVYVHPACPGLTCSLVCISLGPYVLAHGMSNSPSCSEVHQCRLSAADFVKGNIDLRANISSAAEVYRNLHRLSLTVKDQIAYPLLSSMRHELNLEEIYGFMALPTEVKLMVLCLLPVSSILNISATCRELYALANDHTLWQHLCFRDFGLFIKGKYLSWKTEYIRHHKDVANQERNRQIISEAQTFYYQPGVYIPYAPSVPPGILGGRHDWFPNMPYIPGGIQPTPGSHPQRGPVPQPRFDPFGPVPDMDITPGPRRYPPGRGRGRGGFPHGPFF